MTLQQKNEMYKQVVIWTFLNVSLREYWTMIPKWVWNDLKHMEMKVDIDKIK